MHQLNFGDTVRGGIFSPCNVHGLIVMGHSSLIPVQVLVQNNRQNQVGGEQGVETTIPVMCSVFELDLMMSQCTRGVPQLKFRHKIHEM